MNRKQGLNQRKAPAHTDNPYASSVFTPENHRGPAQDGGDQPLCSGVTDLNVPVGGCAPLVDSIAVSTEYRRPAGFLVPLVVLWVCHPRVFRPDS